MILKKGISEKKQSSKKSKDRAVGDPGVESSSIEFIKPRIRDIIESFGEDPAREGLLDTPKRFAKSMGFLTSGYGKTAKDVVGSALFRSESSEMILVRDIELYSMCEHHMLPFFGKAHVAYIPNKKIIGLSKIPRIVDVYSRRLQVQERLTAEIADALMETLKPQGVAVVIEAAHFCMMMRGVEKQNSKTITSAMRGVFYTESDTRREFLTLLKGD
ncbi:MAG: GTP cyclohydrolase I FolE [Bdellovibrionales bacterium]|nr:GTP cyclohydrolase I FolE [Bdellovibrionales bacterium]